MNPFGATTKPLVAAILFITAFFITIPQLGFAQEEDLPNVISGRIWCDDNRDGELNNGERIPDVNISVTGTDTDYSETRTSDESGNYIFTDLPEDTFMVQVDTSTLPEYCNQIISEGPNSEFVGYNIEGSPNSGAKITETIGPLDNMTSVYLDDLTHNVNAKQRFGYVPPPGIVAGTGAIGNYIYCDADLSGNASNSFTSTVTGLADNIREALDDVKVDLTNAGGFTLTTTTGEDGGYLFGNLGVGPYTINVDTTTLPEYCNIPGIDPDGSTPNETQITIGYGATGQGDEQLGADFRYQPEAALGAATGTVWCDIDNDMTRDGNEGISDVAVTMAGIDNGFTYGDVTVPGGRFQFINLPAGNYMLTVDTATLPESCGDPVTDMRDSVSSPVAVTAVSNAVQSMASSGDELEIGYAGTLPVAAIGGRIWCDNASANGEYDDREELTGVELTITGANSGNSVKKGTGLGGIFTFPGLVPDDYTIVVDPSTITGFGQENCINPAFDVDGTPDNMTVVTLSGVDQLDTNFIYSDEPTIIVTPEVTVTPEITITPEVTVTTTPTPTVMVTTTPTPTVVMTTTPEMTITPEMTVMPEMTPTPVVSVTPDASTTPEPTTMPTAQPTAMPTDTTGSLPATVAGTIWDDVNGNGTQDDGEEGLGGVPVTLYDDSTDAILSSLNTDDKGIYQIRVNEPGDYYIKIMVPLNSRITGGTSEIDATTGQSAAFTLVAGQTMAIESLGISNMPDGTGGACPVGGCLYFLPSLQ